MNMLAEISIERLEELPATTMLRLVEKSKKAKKNLAAFQATVTQCRELFLKLEALDIEPDFDMQGGDINIRFAGDGAKLGEVWGELRRAGYNTFKHPAKGDTEFYAHWNGEGLAQIWLVFTSSMCRRVQVGTRTVTKEEPIYETQCGELPELESPAPTLTVIDGGADDDIPF